MRVAKIARKVAVVAVATAMLGGVTVARAADDDPAVPDCSDAGAGQQCEHNITRSQHFRSGEPEIAVNPKDPNNLVYVSTKFKYVRAEVGGQIIDVPGALTQVAVPGTLNCFFHYTFDGGKTWYETPAPIGARAECSDPMVMVDDEGTFFAAFNWSGGDNNMVVPKLVQAPPWTSHDVAVVRSTDGGRTWSGPVATGTTTDRPFFRVDRSTGKLYEASGNLSGGAAALYMVERGENGEGRFLTVSSDKGDTWSRPVPYPGRSVTVHDGIIGTARQLQAVNQGVLGVRVKQGETVLMFYASVDDGQTFTATPVTGPDGVEVFGTSELVAADPTNKGRFAVMQMNADGNYEVYRTTVDPATGIPQGWEGPTVIEAGSGAHKPYLDFGLNGILGVIWKTDEINVQSALSFDGGDTFSGPVRVNGEAHPAESDIMFAGDDLSWLTVDTRNVYLGWGDTRTGYLNSWFARVPISKYR